MDSFLEQWTIISLRVIPGVTTHISFDAMMTLEWFSDVPTGGGFRGFKPRTEIPKALENRAKLKPIVKTVKNCWI